MIHAALSFIDLKPRGSPRHLCHHGETLNRCLRGKSLPRTRYVISCGLICLTLLAVAVPANSDGLPANTWNPSSEIFGGSIAGIRYLPDQNGMLYFGFPAPKSQHSDLLLYRPASRDWIEPLAGKGPHRPRDSLTTIFDRNGRPGLPTVNRPYWLAHQSVYVPPLRKVLYFAGGATFTYDPAERRWQHLDIPLDESPPDVMLGSMAWDPVGGRVILFGGGYISAYKNQPDYIKGSLVRGRSWQPKDWTMAEKRATWAFDPATNTWSRITTGSDGFRENHEAVAALVTKIETLSGSVRGIALEYGDKVSGKTPAQIALDAESLGGEASTFRDRLNRGEGCADAYENGQCRQAAARLHQGGADLVRAAQALKQGDGWKALHALESTRRIAVEAGEDLAPSPLPRYYGNLVTDSRNGLLVLFGGHGGDRILADTWVFDPIRNQWRQSRAKGHPPPQQMPAMSFDSEHGLVLLASGWIYDAARDQWRRLPLTAPKDFMLPWKTLEYDPASRTHVLLTTGDNLYDYEPHPVRIAHLRLSPDAARPADHAGPRWEWLNDKYLRSWAALPRTQAEYRARVAAHKATLATIAPNRWVRIGTPYSAQDRSYGSFALDPERDQLVFWGGGHSAYMGNEVSQYDIKGNLWLESWPPDMPPWPFGSPDGDGWNPPFYHRRAAAHGYHNYAYSAGSGKVLFSAGSLLAYDPDRMRWLDAAIVKSGAGTLGSAVDMSGAPGFYTVSTRHWWGAPFGVWQLDANANTISRIPRSDTPFATNDRAKPVFDPKRNRILFYGARPDSDKVPANQLYAFDIATGGWAKQAVFVQPPGDQPPVSLGWGIAYSPRHDVVMILPGGRKQDTWLLDCGDNTLRRFGPGPATQNEGTDGAVYSDGHDLFIALEVGSNGIGPVTVHAFRLRR